MEWSKDDVERRVLGVLIEKSLAQPDYYPMTLNAVVVACNQKQNRDPVMQVDDTSVYHALEGLRLRGVVTVQLPGPGARTKRYKHEADTYFRWQKRERAVMAELLLRGPQTVGELRSRCNRMAPFENAEIVTNVLNCLADYDPPCVAALPREPGRSAVRYRQLVYDEPDHPVTAVAGAQIAAPSVAPSAAPLAPSEGPQALRTEIENLQAEVIELQDGVADLRRRLELIESRLP
ncbi:MAG: YceH family protein [Phycisphaerales bacterium]|nr:MAG: YceH family protein [Phycisphaerales bacterium]